MIFHIDHHYGGAHVRVRVFSAPHANHTFANLGELTMDQRDWRAFRALLISTSLGYEERPDGSIRVEATEE